MSGSGFASTDSREAAEASLGVALPHEPPAAKAAEAVPKQGFVQLVDVLKWVFSFPAMLGTMLVGAVFVLGRYFNVDPDLWWHLKNGENILATHHWPTTDSFSFTVN